MGLQLTENTSSGMEKIVCGFNTESDFTDGIDSSENTDDLLFVEWGQTSRDRLSFDTEDLDIGGWRIEKPELKSRRSSPSDKVKKRRRTYLLRFYAHHESAKETRSESYVFVHHGNWRQYMKQYRKYHTVGQAGRVNHEDLEWKSLLRHINIGETLKELLFNSSASLHPLPTFPSQHHWCRETSLNTRLPTGSVAPAAAETTSNDQHYTSKRNLFKSFNLASVKQRNCKPLSLWTNIEKRYTKDMVLHKSKQRRSFAICNNEKREIHSGRLIKLLRDGEVEKTSASSDEKVVSLEKVKKVKKSNNGASNLKLQLPRTQKARESLAGIWRMDIGVPKNDVLRTVRWSESRNLSKNVLTDSRRSCNERFEDHHFSSFKAEGLGSLRLQNGGKVESTDEEICKKTTEKAIRQRMGQTGDRVVKKNYGRKLPLIKCKSSGKILSAHRPTLTDDTRENFAIINYGSFRQSEEMKEPRADEGNRGIRYDTRRFAEPLPVETVVFGNKYATAEEHDERLKAAMMFPT